MKRILLLIVLCLTINVFAQDSNPEFVGGSRAMFRFVNKNFVLPVDKKELNGNINIQFEVNKRGVLKNVTVIEGLSAGIDNEIIRVFEIMPKWKPASKNGKSISKVINFWVNLSPFKPVVKELHAFDENIEGEESVNKRWEVIHDITDETPKFTGGLDSMCVFIEKTFVYPEEAILQNEYGTVWIEFVVMSDGTIDLIKVVKGVSPSLNAEAVRVIRAMPKWEPGKQGGKTVNARYTLPVKVKFPKR